MQLFELVGFTEGLDPLLAPVHLIADPSPVMQQRLDRLVGNARPAHLPFRVELRQLN